MGLEVKLYQVSEGLLPQFFEDIEELYDCIDDIDDEQEEKALYLSKEFQAVSICLGLCGVDIGNARKHIESYNAGILTNYVLQNPATKEKIKFGSFDLFCARGKDLQKKEEGLREVSLDSLRKKVLPNLSEFSGVLPNIYETESDLESLFPLVVKTASFYLAAIKNKEAVLSVIFV